MSLSVSEFSGKRVTVVGLARSGIAAVKLLTQLGARVTAVDRKSASALGSVVDELAQHNVVSFLDGQIGRALAKTDLIVTSPGVPMTEEPLGEARRRGIPIISEVELAFPFLEGRLVAVTGTNGKSTTVTMVSAMLEHANIPAVLGGNIGVPLSRLVLESRLGRTSNTEFVIAEISSFQLEAIDRFQPWLAGILNITPDHLDRYPTFQDYVLAKVHIFKRQGSDAFALINLDDPVVVDILPCVHAQLFAFSRRRPVDQGVFLDGDWLFWRRDGRTMRICTVGDIKLQSEHQLENAMAAIAIGLLCGCPLVSIQEVLRTFGGLEHACEVVLERNGITFINDSKATNVAATIRAIDGMKRPVVLIAGGRDKAADFTQLADPVRRQAKSVIVIGESGRKIRNVLEPYVSNGFHVLDADSLETAIRLAVEEATPGDVVLFSPACASFDMFIDYQDRGNRFKNYVRTLDT